MKEASRFGWFGLLAAGIVCAPLPLALTLTTVALRPAEGGVGICDPQRSALCSGLVEWWNFDEAADSTRFGSYQNTPFSEVGGVDVGTGGAKIGSASVYFAASKQLRIPRFGSGMFTSYFTVATWIYVNTTTGNQTVLATTDGLGQAAVTSGIILRLNAGRPEVDAWENETDSGQIYTYPNAISAGAWHLVVWKLSPYGPYGKAQACASVDNGAFGCGNLTYNVRSSSADLTVGGFGTQYLDGYLDGLLIASRAWSPADVALYCNYSAGACQGRTFPFY